MPILPDMVIELAPFVPAEVALDITPQLASQITTCQILQSCKQKCLISYIQSKQESSACKQC